MALKDRNEGDEIAGKMKLIRSADYETVVSFSPSLKAILVKIVRLSVAGGNNYNSVVKELREESFEDHSVCYVGDLKLIETNQPRIFLDEFSNWFDRVERLRFR